MAPPRTKRLAMTLSVILIISLHAQLRDKAAPAIMAIAVHSTEDGSLGSVR